MTTSDLSILIPTRNRPQILYRTLTELKNGGFGLHPLYIYDDASSDANAIREVLEVWEGANLIRGSLRGGQATGRNRLLNATRTEYALLLDDDSWPEDRSLLLNALELMKAERLGVITFQYRSLSDNKLSIPAGAQRGATTSFLGGASIFHVPSVLKVGGYREEFVYGYEEPDLATRLIISGIKIESFPEVVVAHNHFETPGEQRNHAEYHYLYARNSVLLSTLNMPILLGLPHGLLRSFKRSLYKKNYFGAKLLGTLAGIYDTFRLWKRRTPCTWRQAVNLVRNS